jgi:hypothetical protein
MQSVFGAGFLFAIPSGANPTPVRFGAIQNNSVDTSFDSKDLYGSRQFPIEQGRGKGKIEIKSEVGRFDPNLFNQVFFGISLVAGQKLNSVDEAGQVSAASPYQISVANAASWATDLGVYNPNLGIFYTCVASAPAAKQYSVANGVYTFAATEAGNNLQVSYTYTSATTGNTLAVTNQQMGSSPIFGLTLVNQYRGKSLSMTFNAVQSKKLSMPMKLDDFLLSSLDFGAQDDGTGNVFTITASG